MSFSLLDHGRQERFEDPELSGEIDADGSANGNEQLVGSHGKDGEGDRKKEKEGRDDELVDFFLGKVQDLFALNNAGVVDYHGWVTNLIDRRVGRAW